MKIIALSCVKGDFNPFLPRWAAAKRKAKKSSLDGLDALDFGSICVFLDA